MNIGTPNNWYQSLSQRDKRALLFHILYAAEGYDYSLSAQEITEMFNKGFDLDIPFDSTLTQNAQQIINQRQELDDTYKPLLANWRFERIGVCTKLILRYAIWELLNTNTDRTIILNEAIELAKDYAERDAYKFVNGILDEIIKKKLAAK